MFEMIYQLQTVAKLFLLVALCLQLLVSCAVRTASRSDACRAPRWLSSAQLQLHMLGSACEVVEHFWLTYLGNYHGLLDTTLS